MEHNKKNNYNKKYTEKEFFSFNKPDYRKSKDDVWKEITSIIDLNEEAELKNKKEFIHNSKIFYSLAAAIIILLGTTLMLRHYSTSVYCPENKIMTYTLPDGSTIELQQNSSVTYYPLWWKISRKVVLSGEAFFNVEKGNEFMVSSVLGNTIVLGTSFRITASESKYHVTCFTGKVKVVSKSQRSVVLGADYSAHIIHNGEIKVERYTEEDIDLNPENNMFDYKSVPLTNVIRDIENYYNISITSGVELNHNYTGFFPRNKTPEEVLYLLCKPYGLTFVVLSENKYHIIKN